MTMPERGRRLILGIDEAGYGPNLGPLVIGCSAWIVEDLPSKKSNASPAAESLLDRLAPSFLPKLKLSNDTHIPLGDSKVVYASGDSLDSLALGVRYWLEQVDLAKASFQNTLESIAPNCIASLAEIPWYQALGHGSLDREKFCPLDESIPVSLLEKANRTHKKAGVQFLGLAAIVIDESRFNRDVERLENKANLLSRASLQLAAECLKRHANRYEKDLTSIHVYCDKHGGRNHYLALLMDTMPELWFHAVRESAARSDYRARWQERDLVWSFLAKGDRLCASALASMAAKWIREMLMARLNGFWRSHLPDLPPTAGYPMDAKRFRRAIQPIADRLDLPESDWWRCR